MKTAGDPALVLARSFARRFGEPHVALAMHAAVPLGLTPELLAVLRANFVRRAPWIAEADLLLSPLCEETGGGFYQMTAGARELLLDDLLHDEEYGPTRVARVGELLLAYAGRELSRPHDSETRWFLMALEWAGLAYTRPGEAARQLAGALARGLQPGQGGEALRVARVAQALAGPLAGEEKVLLYAAGVARLAEGQGESAGRFFEAIGDVEAPASVGGVWLPPPGGLMRGGGGEERPRPAPPARRRRRPLRVFVSSTVRDLAAHRAALMSLERLSNEFQFVGMEHLPASDVDTLEASRHLLDQSDVLLVVIGWRYGWVPPGHDRSITEMEYEMAAKRGMPRLMFLLDEDVPVPLGAVATGAEAIALEAFRQRVRREVVVETFTTPDDLAQKAMISLAGLPPELGAPVLLPPRDPEFIRRQRLEDLEGLLAGPGRLVGIVGAARSGKTQLAVEYAHAHARRYPGGRILRELGAGTDLPGAFATIAGLLGAQVPEEARRDLNRLFPLLRAELERGPRTLLVLDDLHHHDILAPATRERWLGSGAEADVLVTTPVPLPEGAGASLSLGLLAKEEALAYWMGRAPAGPGVPALLERIIDLVGRKAIAVKLVRRHLEQEMPDEQALGQLVERLAQDARYEMASLADRYGRKGEEQAIEAVLAALPFQARSGRARPAAAEKAPAGPRCVLISSFPGENAAAVRGIRSALQEADVVVSASPSDEVSRSLVRSPEQAVDDCDVVLAIMGPRWSAQLSGVREVLEYALRIGTPVLPVLVEGAHFPAPHELPPSLRGLADRQAFVFRPDEDARANLSHLVLVVKNVAATSTGPEDTREGLLRETAQLLARLLNHQAQVLQALQRLGVPGEQLPVWGNLSPIRYWEEVLRMIENGIVPPSARGGQPADTGVVALLALARERFPYNAGLHNLISRWEQHLAKPPDH